MSFLDLKNVTKIYPNGTKAVHETSLSVEEGEFMVFVGPSGCGKSTLLRMVAGLEDITEGEITLDGNLINEVHKSDIILVGVSRTSKTPTSIYLANKGLKTSNIPLVNENSLPETLKKNPKMACVVGLSTEPERLADLRKNRMNSLKETENTNYTDLENIKKEVLEAKRTFQKYKWPLIDVTRKSVEETAASIIRIHEIYSNNAK